MLNCLLKILTCSIISFVVCIIGVLISYMTQGEDIATKLFYSWVKYFNGIIVGGFGWGGTWYVLSAGKKMLSLLINTLSLSEELSAKLILTSKKATSFRHLSVVTLPVTIIGAVVLVSCGYPLEGFAKVYLALGSISLYWAGAIGFGFIIYTLYLFKQMEDNYQDISIERWSLVIHFDSLNSFFIVSASFAILALIFAFRGTLTANFTFPTELFKLFLSFPLILFLPTILIYSFYPRYVFRKMFDFDVFKQIDQLQSDIKKAPKETLKEKMEMEKTLAEIKEKLIIERKSIPIVSLKDSFSIVLAFIMSLQVIYQNDSVIKDFLVSFFESILK